MSYRNEHEANFALSNYANKCSLDKEPVRRNESSIGWLLIFFSVVVWSLLAFVDAIKA